jgi:hypothetical protein
MLIESERVFQTLGKTTMDERRSVGGREVLDLPPEDEVLNAIPGREAQENARLIEADMRIADPGLPARKNDLLLLAGVTKSQVSDRPGRGPQHNLRARAKGHCHHKPLPSRRTQIPQAP